MTSAFRVWGPRIAVALGKLAWLFDVTRIVVESIPVQK